MFEIPYPNTRYAEALDYEQQMELEDEMYGENISLEEREFKAFAERCKQSKVQPTRLKRFEIAMKKLQREADKELTDLAQQLKIRERADKRTKENYKEILRLRAAIKKRNEQLEDDTNRLYAKYFSDKKRKR